MTRAEKRRPWRISYECVKPGRCAVRVNALGSGLGLLTLTQDIIPRIIWRTIHLETEDKIRKAAAFLRAYPATGDVVHHMSLCKGIKYDSPSHGSHAWPGSASALVYLSRNLRKLELHVWNECVVIAASLHRVDTLRLLFLNIDTNEMMQSMLDSVEWINKLTLLEELEVRTEGMVEDFDMDAIQIPVLRLPALRSLALHIYPTDGLLRFFARARLPHLREVGCISLSFTSDNDDFLEFSQAHSQVQVLTIGTDFLASPDVISTIKPWHLRVIGPLAYLPPTFVRLLSPSVKTLTFGVLDEISIPTWWEIMGHLDALRTAVQAVYLFSTRSDPSGSKPVRRFRWILDVTEDIEEWEAVVQTRMVSYVPLLAKRGITLYDSTNRTLRDYL
jgi:hypothetical protein